MVQGTVVVTGESSGFGEAIALAFAPIGDGARAATAVLTDDAADSPQTVSLAGTAHAGLVAARSNRAIAYRARRMTSPRCAEFKTDLLRSGCSVGRGAPFAWLDRDIFGIRRRRH